MTFTDTIGRGAVIHRRCGITARFESVFESTEMRAIENVLAQYIATHPCHNRPEHITVESYDSVRRVYDTHESQDLCLYKNFEYNGFTIHAGKYTPTD